jgi:hypothetical protein
MALSKRELRRLQAACAKLEDGPSPRCKDYTANLNNLVLDFQMNTRSVIAAMEYFEETHRARTHRQLQTLLGAFPDTATDNRRLANVLWDNNHWTRARFLREVLRCFEQRGIRGQKSLERWVKNADFKRDVQGQFKTSEHSIGYALFQWLKVRLGVETIKPDVHVINFVSEAVGRRVKPEEAVDGLMAIAGNLGRSASLLDAAIWSYQRSRPRRQRKQDGKKRGRASVALAPGNPVRGPAAGPVRPGHPEGLNHGR